MKVLIFILFIFLSLYLFFPNNNNEIIIDNAPIKLADFGTAHVLENEAEDGKLRLRCGTPVYAAPELIELFVLLFFFSVFLQI